MTSQIIKLIELAVVLVWFLNITRLAHDIISMGRCCIFDCPRKILENRFDYANVTLRPKIDILRRNFRGF